MSNHLAGCPFDPDQATGRNACPFTTLGSDLILPHELALRVNQRVAMTMTTRARLNPKRCSHIQAQAQEFGTAGAETPLIT